MRRNVHRPDCEDRNKPLPPCLAAAFKQTYRERRYETPASSPRFTSISRVPAKQELKEVAMRSLKSLPAYVAGVLVVWAVIFAVGYVVHGPTPGHPMLHVFGGFLLGMVSMYIATRVAAGVGKPPASGSQTI
jgi:hypothetical protein